MCIICINRLMEITSDYAELCRVDADVAECRRRGASKKRIRKCKTGIIIHFMQATQVL